MGFRPKMNEDKIGMLVPMSGKIYILMMTVDWTQKYCQIYGWRAQCSRMCSFYPIYFSRIAKKKHQHFTDHVKPLTCLPSDTAWQRLSSQSLTSESDAAESTTEVFLSWITSIQWSLSRFCILRHPTHSSPPSWMYMCGLLSFLLLNRQRRPSLMSKEKIFICLWIEQELFSIQVPSSHFLLLYL